MSSFIDFIKGIGAFVFIGTLMMIGFGITSNDWSAANQKLSAINQELQIDLRHAQEDAAKAKAELADLKSEVAPMLTKLDQTQNTKIPEQAAKLSAQVATSPSEQTIVVGAEKTETLFRGNVSISLIGTTFEGDPLRHKVSATIGGQGFNTVNIEKQDVGYVVELKGAPSYRVRIQAASTFTATFSVTQL